MVGEGGVLKIRGDFFKINFFWNPPGVGVHKTNPLELSDVFSQFWNELQGKVQLQIRMLWGGLKTFLPG